MQQLVCFIFNPKYLKVLISSWMMEKVSLILPIVVDWNCSEPPQQKTSTSQHIIPCNLSDQKDAESSDLLFVAPALNRTDFKLRYLEHGAWWSL